jgi:hypothetical protein
LIESGADREAARIAVEHGPSVQDDTTHLVGGSQHPNIIQGVAIDHDKIGIFAFVQRVKLAVEPGQLRAIRLGLQERGGLIWQRF